MYFDNDDFERMLRTDAYHKLQCNARLICCANRNGWVSNGLVFLCGQKPLWVFLCVCELPRKVQRFFRIWVELSGGPLDRIFFVQGIFKPYLRETPVTKR